MIAALTIGGVFIILGVYAICKNCRYSDEATYRQMKRDLDIRNIERKNPK